jgi:hypothetical protein
MRGVRINLGTTGVTSVSVGGRGARVTIGRGRMTRTVGIPGTGLSHSSQTSYPHSAIDSASYLFRNGRGYWIAAALCMFLTARSGAITWLLLTAVFSVLGVITRRPTTGDLSGAQLQISQSALGELPTLGPSGSLVNRRSEREDHTDPSAEISALRRPDCPKCLDGLICDQHPERSWPHGDCPGPAVPCDVPGCATDRLRLGDTLRPN